ncbi:MAG: aspartate dehydrogenase [SAR202 cluster bacterium]|nr:aspartate dehydrogenase [SAR202 cluster bacterium]MDP6662478.1 aspartate dehydrogenase [SAR202 cluster bacterium]MDP6800144.1 aspartate dehydrogenase [SAR202 cluster bacterium]
MRSIGIAGCGTIGRKVATDLDSGAVPGARLAAITSRDLDKARRFAATLDAPPPVVSLAEMMPLVDLVVEAAPAEALADIATATLSVGNDLMVLSCGALLDGSDLFDLAERNDATIFVPSGAVAGLDGVASAAAGRIDSITMVSRKPPDGLRGAPGIDAAGVDLDSVDEPTLVFDGPVMEACRLFPANVNVSAALSLAGIGPHETSIRIYADPTVSRNTHEILAEGEFGSLTIKIENVPSPSNPKTGILTALSALATLRRITSHVQIGT